MSVADVKLLVGEEEFDIWQSYSIELSMLNIPSAFTLTAPNDEGSMAYQVEPGDEVAVLVDGNIQLTGRVDEVRYNVDADGATVEISGRDNGLFMVDCYPDPQIIKNKTLLEVAEILSGEWIPSWVSSESLEKIKYLKIEPGMTIFDVLTEQARKNKLIIWLESDGRGVIGKPDYDQDPIYELHRHPPSSSYAVMNNILSGGPTVKWSDRYSFVTVYGTSGGTQANYAKSIRSKSTAIDDSETWYSTDRQLIISDSNVKNLKQAKNMAELEVARRKFDSWVGEYTVSGFYGEKQNADYSKSKTQWWVNTRVVLEDEVAGFTGVYYIVKRRFYCNEQGQFTDLELRPDKTWLT